MGTGSQNSDTSTQKDTSHHGAVGKADVDEAHDENISAFIREKYRTKTEEAENGPKLG